MEAARRSPIEVFDDGLPCPEVGGWAETKYRLVSLYCTLFSTGMKDKWGQRAYIDLYAGAGYNKIRGTTKVVAGSPILALTVEHPFDKYIFCEENKEFLAALRIRSKRHHSAANVAYVPGDCNDRIDDIIAAVPIPSAQNTVLSLCFVDPYDIGIKFKTLTKLSARYVDFLLLLALYMDANRNDAYYASANSTKIDEFLGSSDWRERWEEAQKNRVPFPPFLAQQFAGSMARLGYIPQPLYKMKEVRSDEKNLRLYHIALFSRSERAYAFWDDVLKYSTDQISMF